MLGDTAPPVDSRSRAVRPVAWAAILLLALTFRLVGLTRTEVWRDEAITIIHTQAGWLDLLTRLPWVEDTPPLVFLLFKCCSAIDTREWFLRLLPVVFGTAWVHVIMRTAAMIQPRAWWMAGLLAACSQVPIHYSQEIRVYSLALLATAMCFWAVEKALRAANPRRWIYLLAGFCVLVAHCHAVGLLVPPTVLVYLLGRAGRTRWREFLLPGPLVVTVLGLLPMIWFARHWTAVHAAEGDWWVAPMTWRAALHMARHFFGINPLIEWPLTHQAAWKTWTAFAGERIAIFGACAVLGLGLASPGTRRPVAASSLATLTYLALLLLTSVFGLPNIIDRTVLPVWTPVVLALAVGAAADHRRPAAVAGGVLAIAIAAVWAGGWTWTMAKRLPQRPPTRQLFEWLHHQLGPDDLVFTTPRWYKDLTVHQLRDVISADQLLDEYQAYEGRPPRHRLRRESSAGWEARFAERIRAHEARCGPDFGIWIVKYAANREPAPGSPEAFITRIAREVERREVMSDKVVAIVRYQLPAALGGRASCPPSSEPESRAVTLPQVTPLPN